MVIDKGGERQMKETMLVNSEEEARSICVWFESAKVAMTGKWFAHVWKASMTFLHPLVSKNGVHEHRMSEEDNSEDILLFLLLFLSFYRLDFTPHF